MIPGMMSDKGKNLATLIVNGEPRSKEVDPTVAEKDNVGLQAAAEDLLAAIKSDDAKALAKALESAVALFDSDDEPVDEQKTDEV